VDERMYLLSATGARVVHYCLKLLEAIRAWRVMGVFSSLFFRVHFTVVGFSSNNLGLVLVIYNSVETNGTTLDPSS
jgi:hypothetical protein